MERKPPTKQMWLSSFRMGCGMEGNFCVRNGCRTICSRGEGKPVWSPTSESLSELTTTSFSTLILTKNGEPWKSRPALHGHNDPTVRRRDQLNRRDLLPESGALEHVDIAAADRAICWIIHGDFNLRLGAGQVFIVVEVRAEREHPPAG